MTLGINDLAQLQGTTGMQGIGSTSNTTTSSVGNVPLVSEAGLNEIADSFSSTANIYEKNEAYMQTKEKVDAKVEDLKKEIDYIKDYFADSLDNVQKAMKTEDAKEQTSRILNMMFELDTAVDELKNLVDNSTDNADETKLGTVKTGFEYLKQVMMRCDGKGAHEMAFLLHTLENPENADQKDEIKDTISQIINSGDLELPNPKDFAQIVQSMFIDTLSYAKTNDEIIEKEVEKAMDHLEVWVHNTYSQADSIILKELENTSKLVGDSLKETFAEMEDHFTGVNQLEQQNPEQAQGAKISYKGKPIIVNGNKAYDMSGRQVFIPEHEFSAILETIQQR